MPAFIDLSGQRFSALVVISRIFRSKMKTQWLCQCDCGQQTLASSAELKSGRRVSCGCAKSKPRYDDLTDKQFGFLLVLGLAKREANRVWWNCLCICGQIKFILAASLISGKSQSCGCRGSPSRITSGLSVVYIEEYRIFAGMWRRCTNSSCPEYIHYGGRGIMIDPRWKRFDTFLTDMKPRPGKHMTLERLDNNGPYAPWNCIWAPMAVQSRNTRRTKMLTHNNLTQCQKDWAKALGVDFKTITYRIAQQWIEDQIFSSKHFRRGERQKSSSER